MLRARTPRAQDAGSRPAAKRAQGSVSARADRIAAELDEEPRKERGEVKRKIAARLRLLHPMD